MLRAISPVSTEMGLELQDKVSGLDRVHYRICADTVRLAAQLYTAARAGCQFSFFFTFVRTRIVYTMLLALSHLDRPNPSIIIVRGKRILTVIDYIISPFTVSQVQSF